MIGKVCEVKLEGKNNMLSIENSKVKLLVEFKDESMTLQESLNQGKHLCEMFMELSD